MIVDFHCHTFYSDGGLSPADIHGMMAARGVQVYAISDHDSLAAHRLLDDHPSNGSPTSGPRRVVGVEINTNYQSNEVHILGYGFAASGSSLDHVIAENQRARLTRLQKIVEQFVAADMPLTLEDILLAAGPTEAMGRPHVARALVTRGYASDVQSAMKRFLKPKGIGYVPSAGISPLEAIACIHEAGGVAVLAHPCRLEDYGLIETLSRSGLDGLELYYPRHTPNQMVIFRDEAQRFNLFVTAGSDFHEQRHSPQGVGMEVPAEDLKPFLDRVAP